MSHHAIDYRSQGEPTRPCARGVRRAFSGPNELLAQTVACCGRYHVQVINSFNTTVSILTTAPGTGTAEGTIIGTLTGHRVPASGY